jgi:conjugative relaxase-like TrwC/TraI family protein
MLRITQQTSSAGAKRYFSTADYLSEGQELVGRWGGIGAASLGQEGTVSEVAFERLCDNLHPRDGGQLTVRTRFDRTVGYDFTWSVPKSVSLLYGMTGDKAILHAFRESVRETMRDIESEMKTRVRVGGEDTNRVSGNIVYAEFIHTTSRPVDGIPDPQLHSHCFVFNTTWDDTECRWKAGQFRELKRDAPYFQAAFRVRLANRLQDMGFGIERKRDDFEIIGIPTALIKRFSRRTEEIEKEAARLGITDPDRKAELGATTREKKNKEMTIEELRTAWDNRMSRQERKALDDTFKRSVAYARPLPGEAKAVDYALSHSFVREAVVTERTLVTEALKRGVGSVTVEDVKRELAKRSLIRGEQDGRKMATTHKMLEMESSVIEFARGGRGRFRPLGDPDREFHRDWLNDGQKEAIRHVLGSRDGVTIIRGAAGTGKTTLEQELGEALAEAGLAVVALAPTAEASRNVLRKEAGFATAETVARFLIDKEMQQTVRGGVVLVDEASLLGTKDMLDLFHAAEDIAARVVLVGDRKQHRSVSAGEPLKLLQDRAGLPVAEVTEILRQKGDYKKAAIALSEGKIEPGLKELDKLGWIKEVADGERYQQLAGAYLAATRETKPGGEHKSAIVVSPTHAEAAKITATIRASLQAEGKLGKEHIMAAWAPAHLTDAQKADATNVNPGDLLQFHQHAPGHKRGSRLVVAGGEKLPVQHADRFEVYRPVQLPLAVGDRVRVTANGKTADGKHRISNGAIYTVKGFTPQGDVIVDRGWVIDKEFGHLAHGYVVTSHTSQGKTVDKVFVGLSSQSYPATTERTAYVALTRGKEQAVVFTDDKHELLRVTQREDEPMSATELAERTAKKKKPTLRDRLRKHLANLRRLTKTFERTREPRRPEKQPTPTFAREKHHER